MKTLEVLESIANSVCNMLKWELDITDFHPDGKLPVLDIKLFINPENPKSVLCHNFYKKSMCTKTVIPASSAMPMCMKKSVLIQEGLRRVRNNSLSSQLEDFIRDLKEYNIELYSSGYSELFRLKLSEKILAKYQIQLDSHKDAKVSFYRTKQQCLDFKKQTYQGSLHVEQPPYLANIRSLKQQQQHLTYHPFLQIGLVNYTP